MPIVGERCGSRDDSSSAPPTQWQPCQQQQPEQQECLQQQQGQQQGLQLASRNQPQRGGLGAAGLDAAGPSSGKRGLPAATLPPSTRQDKQPNALPGRGIPAATPAAVNGAPPATEAPTYQTPLHLLSLPDAALCHVLRHLTAAADLARCAAACKALRELTNALSWDDVTLLEAHFWGPGIAAGLSWVVKRCPGIVRVDLGGMGPCGESELEALVGLKAVRELSLRDCWHFQGISSVELELVQSLPCLTFLDLSGTGALLGGVSLLRALPPQLRELKMARMLPGPTADVFPSLMMMPNLVSLDFSSNPWITSTHIEQLVRLWDLNRMMAQMGGGGAAAPAPAAVPAAAAAADGPQAAAQGPSQQQQQAQQAQRPAQRRRSVAMDRWPRLRRLSFRGCEQLGGLGQLFVRHPGLTHVDVSGTATCDADVEVLAETCEALASLDVSGCVRFKGPALCALSRSAAVHSGALTELRLSDLPWVKPQNLMQILGALSEWNALCQAGPVKLDLSHCGGLNETSLLELLPWEDEESGSADSSPARSSLYPSQQQQHYHANPQPQQAGRGSGRVRSRLRWLRWPGSSSGSGGSGRSRGARSSSASEGSLVGTPDSSTGLGRLSRGSSSQGAGGSPSARLAGSAGSAGSIMSSAAASPVAGGTPWVGPSEMWEGPLRFEELSVAGASRLSAGVIQQLAEWRPWGVARVGLWEGAEVAEEANGRPRVEGRFQPGRATVPGDGSSGRLARKSSAPGPASKWLSSMLGRASTGSASTSALAAAGVLSSRQPSGSLTPTPAASNRPLVGTSPSSTPLSPHSSQAPPRPQPASTCFPSFSSGSLVCTLQLLDVSHCECFRGSTPGGRAALGALFQAAGPALRTLRLDGCHVGGGVLGLLAEACPGLEELSVVGCKGATNDDFLALASALCALRSLAVGGAVMSWREDVALAAFTGLRSLRIARRSFLTDHQLFPALAAIPSLKELALASCPSLTDASLESLPRGVQQLHLVCCERLTGAGLEHLRSLQSLKFSGCPAITEAAVQHLALSCPHLTMLELPGHIRPNCLPVAAPNVVNHLRGLQVVGGSAEPAGGGGLGRRWRQRGSRRSGGGGGG